MMRRGTARSLFVPILVLAFLVAAGLAAVYPALAASPSFSDVAGTPYEAAIGDLADLGIVNGFADGTFRPGNSVTRQQFAKMIVKTMGYPVTGTEICPFTDVDKTPNPVDPFYPAKYVAVCALQGITTGKTSTLFAPHEDITRQQLITMVVRAAAAELPEPPAGYTPPFSPVQFGLQEHYMNARKAEYAGLLAELQGIGSAYLFTASATRGEVAQILWNLLQLQGGLPVSTTTSSTMPSTTTTTVPASASGDLLHFSWEWGGPVKDPQVENVGYATGAPKITGPVYRTPWMSGSSTVVATGVNGHLQLFTVAEGGHLWTREDLSTATGQTVVPGTLIGPYRQGPATGAATLHLAAVGPGGDLLHFSATTGGSWICENASAATGYKIAVLNEDITAINLGGTTTLVVFGRTPSGDLIEFLRPSGGAWQAVNVSTVTGKKIVGTPMLFVDDTQSPIPMLSVAATGESGPIGGLVLFHCDSSGTWGVENVSLHAEISYGGYLRTTPGDSPIAKRLLVLDAENRLWELSRITPSLPDPWKVKSISSSINEQFAVVVRQDTIFAVPEFPVVPSDETHFTGVGTDGHLIEFWCDGDGYWWQEDLTSKTSQPIYQQVGLHSYSSPPPLNQHRRDFLGISSVGQLIFIWGDPGARDWKASDFSALVGRYVLPGWHTGFWTDGGEIYGHLVAIGK